MPQLAAFSQGRWPSTIRPLTCGPPRNWGFWVSPCLAAGWVGRTADLSSNLPCRWRSTRITLSSGGINMPWPTWSEGLTSRRSSSKESLRMTSAGRSWKRHCLRTAENRDLMRTLCKFQAKRWSRVNSSKPLRKAVRDYQCLINNGLFYNFKQGSL